MVVASNGYKLSPIRFSDIGFQKLARDIPEEERPPAWLPKFWFDPEVPYASTVAYGHSKAANVFFANSLAKGLRKEGIVCVALHPGGMSLQCKDEGSVVDGWLTRCSDLDWHHAGCR